MTSCLPIILSLAHKGCKGLQLWTLQVMSPHMPCTCVHVCRCACTHTHTQAITHKQGVPRPCGSFLQPVGGRGGGAHSPASISPPCSSGSRSPSGSQPSFTGLQLCPVCESPDTGPLSKSSTQGGPLGGAPRSYTAAKRLGTLPLSQALRAAAPLPLASVLQSCEAKREASVSSEREKPLFAKGNSSCRPEPVGALRAGRGGGRGGDAEPAWTSFPICLSTFPLYRLLWSRAGMRASYLESVRRAAPRRPPHPSAGGAQTGRGWGGVGVGEGEPARERGEQGARCECDEIGSAQASLLMFVTRE